MNFITAETFSANNTCNPAVFETKEPLRSDNIPPLSHNNFNTHIAQYHHM
jgi:hypothetical protein